MIMWKKRKSSTTFTFNGEKVFLAARNTIFVIYKNMPVLQLALNVPFIFTGMFIKTLFLSERDLEKTTARGF